MAKVTYVHFGAGESEIGIQFETDDGAGGVVEGKSFADLDPSLKDLVFKSAQSALDALTGELPADYPPGLITSALMKARNARQEAEAALAQKQNAEEAARAVTVAAEEARARAEADRLAHEEAAKQAAEEKVGLDAQIEKSRAAEAEVDARIAAKLAAESELTTRIASLAEQIPADVEVPVDATKDVPAEAPAETEK